MFDAKLEIGKNYRAIRKTIPFFQIGQTKTVNKREVTFHVLGMTPTTLKVIMDGTEKTIQRRTLSDIRRIF
jgi:DNA-binding Xre family transcriptional regulator